MIFIDTSKTSKKYIYYGIYYDVYADSGGEYIYTSWGKVYLDSIKHLT